MAYQPNDKIVTTSPQTIGFNSQQYDLPLDSEGAVISDDGVQIIARFNLNGVDVDLPVHPMTVGISRKSDRAAKLKEVKNNPITRTDIQAAFTNAAQRKIVGILLARILYLESQLNINLD